MRYWPAAREGRTEHDALSVVVVLSHSAGPRQRAQRAPLSRDASLERDAVAGSKPSLEPSWTRDARGTRLAGRGLVGGLPSASPVPSLVGQSARSSGTGAVQAVQGGGRPGGAQALDAASAAMDTLVFRNGGVFQTEVPAIDCNTCKARREKRLRGGGADLPAESPASGQALGQAASSNRHSGSGCVLGGWPYFAM